MQEFYEPKAGEIAPDFKLPSTEGRQMGLRNFKGRWVILYFYPKDDTPGCTAEACGFRDGMTTLTSEGAVVLGVSTDPMASHDKFRTKHGLNFALLSDESADVAKMYGVWKEKNLQGRRSWGMARATYIIGPDGRVRKVYRKVKADEHAPQVIADLAELKGAEK